ncbi:MAG: YfiR family protein [Nitrospinae bacterium]|nr:YfiR family protein [Nitrospinota bacterium]
MFYRLFLLLLILPCLLFDRPSLDAQEFTPSEYQVKAAFLYNFLKFVEWPPDAPHNDTSTLSVCILGEDHFGSALDAMKENAVQGKMIAIKRTNNLRNIKDCSVIFISGSEKKNLGDILQFLKDSAVLTISDIDGFAEAGGIIAFVREDGKVRFKININAARQSQLKVSSKLLKLAHIVGDSK